MCPALPTLKSVQPPREPMVVFDVPVRGRPMTDEECDAFADQVVGHLFALHEAGRFGPPVETDE